MANTVFVIMFVVFIAILVGCGFYAKRWVSEAATTSSQDERFPPLSI